MRIEAVTVSSPEAAYERAFETHWHDVFRLALAWTNDWAAAEDLAQEAYVRLWKSRSTLDWQETMLPWLLVATRRLATDRFRALRRRLAGTPPAPTLTEETQSRWLDVQSAMSGLSPLERSSIVLTAIEGWTTDAASEALGVSPGSVRSAVSRARAKLEAAT